MSQRMTARLSEPGLATRRVVLNVEIDEPKEQKVEVAVSTQAHGTVMITAR
jgi:hypothetical protein